MDRFIGFKYVTADVFEPDLKSNMDRFIATTIAAELIRTSF